MKSLLFLIVAAVALSGCAYYPAPYYGGYGGYGYAAPAVSIGVWGGDGGHYRQGGREGDGRWRERR